MASFDEVYAQLSADEKKFFDNTLQKHPDLKAGWMAQKDYSKKTQELATQRRELDDKQGDFDRWKSWADNNIPKYQELVNKGVIDDDGNDLWADKERKYQADIEELRQRAIAGGEMDPAELDKLVQAKVTSIIKDSGMQLSKDEVAALVAAETKSAVTTQFKAEYDKVTEEFNSRTLPFTASLSAAMAMAAIDYRETTGEKFTKENQNELYAVMKKEDNWDPREAVQIYMKPKVEEKRIAKEIEDKAEARYREMVSARGGMPGGGDEPYVPGQGRGNLQRLLEESKSEAAPMDNFEGFMNDKVREAAKSLVTEGKF